MNEELRTIVTWWRLPCPDLAIETGRYAGIVKHERLCSFSDVIEAYTEVRKQFKDLLAANPTIHQILNPKDKNTAILVGMLLKTINKRRKMLFR